MSHHRPTVYDTISESKESLGTVLSAFSNPLYCTMDISQPFKSVIKADDSCRTLRWTSTDGDRIASATGTKAPKVSSSLQLEIFRAEMSAIFEGENAKHTIL